MARRAGAVRDARRGRDEPVRPRVVAGDGAVAARGALDDDAAEVQRRRRAGLALAHGVRLLVEGDVEPRPRVGLDRDALPAVERAPEPAPDARVDAVPQHAAHRQLDEVRQEVVDRHPEDARVLAVEPQRLARREGHALRVLARPLALPEGHAVRVPQLEEVLAVVDAALEQAVRVPRLQPLGLHLLAERRRRVRERRGADGEAALEEAEDAREALDLGLVGAAGEPLVEGLAEDRPVVAGGATARARGRGPGAAVARVAVEPLLVDGEARQRVEGLGEGAARQRLVRAVELGRGLLEERRPERPPRRLDLRRNQSVAWVAAATSARAGT